MTYPSLTKRINNLIALGLTLLPTALSAANYTWDGGSGVWNTSSVKWNSSTVAWPSSGTDNAAIFGGTAGTVTLSGSVAVNQMTFNTANYIIGTLGSSTLTLNGSAPRIITNQSASIYADLVSANGFTWDSTSSGVLALKGNNSGLQGTVYVQGNNQLNLQAGNAGSKNATWDIQNSIVAYNTSNAVVPGSATIELGALSGNSAAVLRTAGAEPNALGTWVIGALNTDTTFAGHVTDATQNNTPITLITKTGTGSLTLSGDSTNTGVTTVSQGTLVIGSDAVATTIAKAGVTVNSSTDTITYTNNFTNGDRALFTNTAVGSLSGGLQVNTTYYIINRTATTFQVSATLGGAAIDLTSSGSGVLVSEAGSLGSTNSAVVVGDSSTGSNAVSLLINGAHTIERAVTVNDFGTSTTLGGNSDHNSTFSGAVALGKTANLQSVTTGVNSVTFSGVLSGAGGITKTGSGRVTLTNANTFLGSTTINEGTLILSGTGAVSSSSTVDVKNGATLDHSGVTGGTYSFGTGQTLKGSGTVIGNSIVNGSLQPGNSPGVLTFTGDLTLGSTANSTFEIQSGTPDRGTNYDGVTVTGLLSYNGTLTLSLTTLVAGGTYDLFNFTSVAGNFTSVVFAGGAYTGTFSYDGSAFWNATSQGQTFNFELASGDLIISAIPEPSTTLLLAAALLTALLWNPRRSHGKA